MKQSALFLGWLASFFCCLLLSVYAVSELTAIPSFFELRVFGVALASSLFVLGLLQGLRRPALRLLGAGWGTALMHSFVVYAEESPNGGLLGFAHALDFIAFEVIGSFLLSACFTPIWLFFRQRKQRPSLDRFSGLPWLAVAISIFALFPLAFASQTQFTLNELLLWRWSALALGLAALVLALFLFVFSLLRRRWQRRWLAAIATSSVEGWRLAPAQQTLEEDDLPLFSSEISSPDHILYKRIESKQEAYRGENIEQPVARLSINSKPKDALLLNAIIPLFILSVGVAMNLFSPWSSLSSPTQKNLREVFGGGDVILVGGDEGLLLRSKNQGEHWEIVRAATPTKSPITSIRGSSKDFYAISGSEILYSKDQGETWQSQTLYGDFAAQAPGAGPSETLYLSTDGNIKRSTNNGLSWETATLPAEIKNPLSFVVVRFVSSQEVYLGGKDALFVGSFDNGWKRVDYKNWAHKYKDNLADPTKLLWVSDSSQKDAPYFYFLKTFQAQFATFTKEGKELDTNAVGVYALWISPNREVHMPGASYQINGVWGYGGQQGSSARFFLSKFSFSNPNAVWGDTSGNVISVYQNGMILLEKNGSESEENSVVDVNLNAIWADNEGYFYAVGDQGVILRRK